MSRPAWILAAVLAAVAFLCAVPARTLADATQSSMMMDDDQLIYVSQQHMVSTLQRMAWLGANVVKVSMVWQLVAPDPTSTKRPNFDASDPAAYPRGVWGRWDALVQTAHQLGMNVYFLIIGPAPKWAIPAGNRNTGQGPDLGEAPSANEYRQYVQAVGRRYSGAYVPGSAAPDAGSTTTTPVGVTVPGVTISQGSTPSPVSPAIPRVDYWGLWNEPNERSWLNPWYKSLGSHHLAYIQPEEYRGLVDAGWSGLSASSHSSDTVMIGETANRGILTPTQFVRGLYCVGNNLRPLRGSAASNVGCPTSGRASQFANQHPGLFEAAGWAHHPYSFDVPPNRPYPDRTWVTIQNLGSFERLLTGIYSVYGLHPSQGVSLYLTEWGEKSNPPNPYVKTTTAEQADWINQAEYMTWRMPYVRGLDQFLLVDSPPRTEDPKGSPLYWSSYQTGLEFQNGSAKPALPAYRVPIWLPTARHGHNVGVWGQLRPANHSSTQDGVIEFQSRGSSRWSELGEVQTSSPEGFIYNHVNIPSAGSVRLGWLDPGGAVVYSRSVAVS